MSIPYMVEHRNGWKYVRTVPRDVRETLGGLKHWVKMLGSSYPNAKAAARALAVEHDRLIAGLRQLAPQERVAFAAAGGLAGLQRASDDRGAIFVAAAAEGLAPDPEADEATQALQALESVRAHKDATRIRREAAAARQRLAKLAPASGVSFMTLVDVWREHAQPRSAHSVDRFTLYAQRFVDVVGDVAPKNVTPRHVEQFRDALEERQNVTRSTKAKHLEALHRLFTSAQSAGLVTSNPAHGIKLRKVATKFADVERRLPFTADQVRAIFATLPGETPDFQWIVRLLAYHGARSGELAQLRVADVMMVQRIPVLRITDAAEDGSVKNRFSVRVVPIHPACLEIVAYAASRPGDWLFGTIPVWGTRRGAGFQRMATDFLRKRVKITDKRLTMHSFRHTWRDLARAVEMHPDVSSAIMGHSLGKGEHAAYGTGLSLPRLLREIRKIDPLK